MAMTSSRWRSALFKGGNSKSQYGKKLSTDEFERYLPGSHLALEFPVRIKKEEKNLIWNKHKLHYCL